MIDFREAFGKINHLKSLHKLSKHGVKRKPLNPFMPNGISHSYSTGKVHFRFKGRCVVFFIFNKILIEHSVSKPWRH